MVRVVISGCRDYSDYDEAKRYIEFCLKNVSQGNDIIVVSGCASGADAIGERYAKEKGWIVERYPANWQTYGKSAGPRRNKQMAEICDYVICFWDGKSRGTKSMIEYAIKYHRPYRIKFI